jgi:tetrapyrrole methylase family protein / MazG family protein
MTTTASHAHPLLEPLVRLVERLRGENGCPWDRQQTPQSLAVYLIEEMYELVDAIESGSPAEVCEEIGDVLFHLVFLTRMFQEKDLFDMTSVVRTISEKMIRRHPHVFGTTTVDNTEQVKQRWSEIKKAEKAGSAPASILDSIPVTLPALMRAYRISERAARAGFDWPDMAGVMEKVEEEWAEFKAALADGSAREPVSLEFGDILFTLVNVARFTGLHPETALSGSTRKFGDRFRVMEKELAARGTSIDGAGRETLDRLWEEAKREIDRKETDPDSAGE